MRQDSEFEFYRYISISRFNFTFQVQLSTRHVFLLLSYVVAVVVHRQAV